MNKNFIYIIIILFLSNISQAQIKDHLGFMEEEMFRDSSYIFTKKYLLNERNDTICLISKLYLIDTLVFKVECLHGEYYSLNGPNSKNWKGKYHFGKKVGWWYKLDSSLNKIIDSAFYEYPTENPDYFIQYDERENKLREGKIRNGLKVENWVWYRNGKDTSVIYEFSKDLNQCTRKEYEDISRKLRKVSTYKNGILEGNVYNYNSKRKTVRIERYSNNKLNGKSEFGEFQNNPKEITKLRQVQYYKNGIRHGKGFEYEDGKIISEREYFEGERTGKWVSYTNGDKVVTIWDKEYNLQNLYERRYYYGKTDIVRLKHVFRPDGGAKVIHYDKNGNETRSHFVDKNGEIK